MVGSSKGSDWIHMGLGDDTYFIRNNLDLRDAGIDSSDVNYIYDSGGKDTISILDNPGRDSYKLVSLDNGGLLIELSDGAEHIFGAGMNLLSWVGDTSEGSTSDFSLEFDIVTNVEDVVGGKTVFAGTDGDDIVDLRDAPGGTGENVSSWSEIFLNGGNDTYYGSEDYGPGEGDTWVTGFLVYGGEGDDFHAPSQDSNIRGGAGDDYIEGGSGDDELRGVMTIFSKIW